MILDKEKIVKVLDMLEGITYKEWKFIYRKVDEYYREEISKLADKIELADSQRLMMSYSEKYKATLQQSE